MYYWLLSTKIKIYSRGHQCVRSLTGVSAGIIKGKCCNIIEICLVENLNYFLRGQDVISRLHLISRLHSSNNFTFILTFPSASSRDTFLRTANPSCQMSLTPSDTPDIRRAFLTQLPHMSHCPKEWFSLEGSSPLAADEALQLVSH